MNKAWSVKNQSTSQVIKLKRMKNLTYVIAIFSMAIFATSCTDDGGEDVQVTSNTFATLVKIFDAKEKNIRQSLGTLDKVKDESEENQVSWTNVEIQNARLRLHSTPFGPQELKDLKIDFKNGDEELASLQWEETLDVEKISTNLETVVLKIDQSKMNQLYDFLKTGGTPEVFIEGNLSDENVSLKVVLEFILKLESK